MPESPLSTAPSRRSAFDLTFAELCEMNPPNDSRHLYGKMFRVHGWENGSPTVGKAARAFLDAHFDFSLPEIVERRASEDGATKLLLKLSDGNRIEAVHMPRAVKNPRVTLCISSQVGCAMGCTFCHTGTMGLVRNLTAGEIVGQVLQIVRTLGPAETNRVTLVFMGMGEPLHNTHEVLRAIEVLCEPAGMGLAPTRITVSTSGLVSGIDELARARVRPTLALSLNATTDEARLRTMPITKKFSLADLHDALVRFPLRAHEKVTIEYVLLRGENDSLADAKRLAEFAAPFRHNVNVIPYNVYEGSAFSAPEEETIQRFVRTLQDNGALATVRRSRGRDVAAACGQLVQTETIRRRLHHAR